MKNLFIVALIIIGMASCLTPAYKQYETHSYKLTVVDIDGKPIKNANVKYSINDKFNSSSNIKDSVVTTDNYGIFNIVTDAKLNPAAYNTSYATPGMNKFSGVATYNTSFVTDPYETNFKYEVSKEGYYPQKEELTNLYCSQFAKYYTDTTKLQPNTAETVFINRKSYSQTADIKLTLFKPIDYFNPSFLKNEEGTKLKSDILFSLDYILLESLLADCHMSTRTIDFNPFKDKKYLSFTFDNDKNTYNSIKLNKYDIGKRMFDDVVRKMLNPLDIHLGRSEDFFGYDIIIYAYTKDFIEEYASSKRIRYEFLMPKDAVRKYKEKEISSQQLLDGSIILMDDDRVEFKFQ